MTKDIENKKAGLIGILVLVLPLIVLAGMTAKAVTERNVGDHIWQVEITGYDPRDLLYGHYLTFRYNWNEGERSMTVQPEIAKDDTCLCLNGSGNGNKDPMVRPLSCTKLTKISCESKIRVYPHNGFYSFTRDSATGRYFIPEAHAQELESLLRKGKNTFRIEFMARDNQSVAVRGLYIDDTDMETYLRSLPDERE